jgi:hypothetical protein
MHYPSNAKERDEKIGKALQTVAQPFMIRLLGDNSKYHRRNQREQKRHFKMGQI